MLHTNLEHIESDKAFQDLIESHDEVMLCCGREGPMCVPVYEAMLSLRPDRPEVAFRDMMFDGPAAHNIRSLPEVQGFMGLPFTVYFKGGKVVAATTSIQSQGQVEAILEREFDGAAPQVAEVA